MTKLSTHIPLEYIEQSKKLQEIDINNYHCQYREQKKGKWINHSTILQRHNSQIGEHNSNNPDILLIKIEKAPTIADVIDNAEMLFGDNTLNSSPSKASQILFMCQQNKSIQEISEYIIKNIKN